MFFSLLAIIFIFGSFEAKPVFVRNITDCSITYDGIINYSGKHSFSKFEHECLPWSDFQTEQPDIINEANFFDPSIKAAKNYCRNPTMELDGPWCFVQNEDTIVVEGCDVCQSLVPRPTIRTDISFTDVVATDTPSKNFLHEVRDEMKRFFASIREKILSMVNRMKAKIRQLRQKFSDRFNF